MPRSLPARGTSIDSNRTAACALLVPRGPHRTPPRREEPPASVLVVVDRAVWPATQRVRARHDKRFDPGSRSRRARRRTGSDSALSHRSRRPERAHRVKRSRRVRHPAVGIEHGVWLQRAGVTRRHTRTEIIPTLLSSAVMEAEIVRRARCVQLLVTSESAHRVRMISVTTNAC
jgi:hypothetical protein